MTSVSLSKGIAMTSEQLLAFQEGVDAWMDACFGDAIKADVQERCDRFIEEALEFVQAAGYSADRAHALVDYTFERPQGEINQEVGGVMVTLAAMCNTLKINIGLAAETELARVWTKIDTIRAKQAAKPTGSALPSRASPLITEPVDVRVSAILRAYEHDEMDAAGTIEDLVELIDSMPSVSMMELLDRHIQRCRDAIAECQKWSPAQAEWSRARDALLNFRDEVEALSIPQNLEGTK